MTTGAVFWRRKAFFANGYRSVPVFSPGAVDINGEPVASAGKRAKGANWRGEALGEVPRAVRLPPDSDALNTAFLTDDLPVIDVDVMVPHLVDLIVAMIERGAGVTPLVRQGQAPKLALFYRSLGPFQRLSTAKLQFNAGEKPTVVEILGEGQSCMADGVHPGTMQPYRWFDQHPLDVERESLPVLSPELAREIIAEAEGILRAAGAVDWVNPNAAARPERVTEQKSRTPRSPAIGEGFFHKVNDMALDRAEDWVRVLWPQLRGPAANGAWRVHAGMRGLPASKQDLSIDPAHGIRDWHLDKGMTAIDLAIEYGGQKDAVEAALWLCAQMHVDPLTLGYRDRAAERPPLAEPPPPDGEPPPPPDEDPPGPIPEREIWVYAGLRHVAAREGLMALREARIPFYRREWQLLQVCAKPVKRSDGNLADLLDVVSVGDAGLCAALAQSATWHKINAKGHVIRLDPDVVVPLVREMYDLWRFPALHGIVRTPTLRVDGTLLAKPGYDAKSGMFVALDPDLKMPFVPERPSREQAFAALELLRELLAEFPFVDEASRSVALSLLITPVVRVAMPTAPLHLVTAPSPGTGKSYLVDVAAMIATGDAAAVIAMAQRDEETEKRLIGAALGSRNIVCLDNIRRVVESDFLCQLAERRILELRPLGTSTKVDVVNLFVTVLNGNNLTVADDLVRRSIRCSLDANMANPEQRQFSFDPLARVRAARGQYVAACLTIVRAYLGVGLPDRCPTYGSYEGWSNWVRSALVWLGCADPVSTVAELRDDDPERQELGLVFSEWLKVQDLVRDQTGWMTSELLAVAESHPDFFDALVTVAPSRAEARKIDRTRLGNWLKRRVNRVAEDHKLVVNRADKARPRWRLIPAFGDDLAAEVRGFGPPD